MKYCEDTKYVSAYVITAFSYRRSCGSRNKKHGLRLGRKIEGEPSKIKNL